MDADIGGMLVILSMLLMPIAYMWFSPSCICCPVCDECTTSTPSSVQLDITGVVAGTCINTDCVDDVNGSYVCPRLTGAGVECEWRFVPGSATSFCTAGPTTNFSIARVQLTTDRLIGDWSHGSQVISRRSQATGYDGCKTWSGFLLDTHDSNTSACANSTVDWEVTAL